MVEWSRLEMALEPSRALWVGNCGPTADLDGCVGSTVVVVPVGGHTLSDDPTRWSATD